jgi:uncharacterized protein YerC
MHTILKRQLLKTFSQMINDLSNPGEVETFLTDFFSDAELETYIKRISAAYWTKKGRDDKNIILNLQASVKDLDAAKVFLKKKGGKLAIKKMEAEEWANVWSEKIKKITKNKS